MNERRKASSVVHRMMPVVSCGWLKHLFNPRGWRVFNLDIQKSSRFSMNNVSCSLFMFFSIFSIIVNFPCWWNWCPSDWKCLAASMQWLFLMSLLYWAIRKWNGDSDFPTYCSWHLMHSRRYITCFVLQSASWKIWKVLPVCVLVKLTVSVICLQHSAFKIQQSVFKIQPSAFNLQHLAFSF